MLSWHRIGAGHFDLGWIDVLTILLESEVKMWARRQSSGANIADDFLLPNSRTDALPFAEFGHVHVERCVAAVVIDDYAVARASATTAKDDLA